MYALFLTIMEHSVLANNDEEILNDKKVRRHFNCIIQMIQ